LVFFNVIWRENTIRSAYSVEISLLAIQTGSTYISDNMSFRPHRDRSVLQPN